MTSQVLQTEPYSLHLCGSHTCTRAGMGTLHTCTRAGMGTSRSVLFLIIVMMLTAVTAMMVMVTAVMMSTTMMFTQDLADRLDVALAAAT